MIRRELEEEPVDIELENDVVEADGAWEFGAETWEYADTEEDILDKGAPSVSSNDWASLSVSPDCLGVPEVDEGCPGARGGTSWTWRFKG